MPNIKDANEILSQALEIAQSIEDAGHKAWALRLINRNIEQFVRNAEVIGLALESARSNVDLVQGLAIEFFSKLVDKGLSFDTALEVAQIGIKRDSIGIKRWAIELFHRLVQKNQGIEQTINAAKQEVGIQARYTREYIGTQEKLLQMLLIT